MNLQKDNRLAWGISLLVFGFIFLFRQLEFLPPSVSDIIFDFKNYLHLNANSLPLGIKQRLSLACSVMHEPKVLFLDEPTSGVDPITRKEFWTHINGMVKKGVSIMVTTHFMDEAEYCDKIMLIYKGKNIASGTPDELKALVGPNASMQDAFITLVKKYDKEDL